MNKELTREADALICLIYNAYMQKRKQGVSKGNAKMIGGSAVIRNELMTKWSLEDVDETCRELGRSEFLDCVYSDDVVSESALTDSAIKYMENRFKNNAEEVLKHIETLKKIILF